MSHAVGKRGFVAIVAVRLVPIAPFSAINLVAGALSVRAVHYTVGTALGLAPGIVIMSLLGDRVLAMLDDLSRADLGIVIGGSNAEDPMQGSNADTQAQKRSNARDPMQTPKLSNPICPNENRPKANVATHSCRYK